MAKAYKAARPRPAIRLGVVSNRWAAEAAAFGLKTQYHIAVEFYAVTQSDTSYTYAIDARERLGVARRAEVAAYVAGVEMGVRAVS